MILQDLINQYIPTALQAEFFNAHPSLGGGNDELADERAKEIAQLALNFLGISAANTPHVSNVAPENLPPAEPVWAPAEVTTENTVVLGEEEDNAQKIAQLEAELAALKVG